jgi:hypothetical protein
VRPAALALSLSLLICGADKSSLESGLRVGEIANPFSVQAVTGPFHGKTLCYRCKLGNSPVVCIFARRITKPLETLLKKLDDRIASKEDGLKALVVVLTAKPDTTAKSLETLAQRRSLDHVPLTLVSNPHGPQDYKIAEQAEVTILMWRGPTVRVNRAFAEGKLSEACVKEILNDLPELLKD